MRDPDEARHVHAPDWCPSARDLRLHLALAPDAGHGKPTRGLAFADLDTIHKMRHAPLARGGVMNCYSREGKPAGGATTNLDPATIVRRVMLTVVKMRSIAGENEGLDVAEYISPRIYGTGPLSLLTVCERMLDGGREVAPIDAMNVLSLAWREPTFPPMYYVRWGSIEDPTSGELPQPLSVFS